MVSFPIFLWILLIILTLDVHALDPGRAITQYYLQMWQTEDGLPQNTVQTVTQTRDGYIWLGTQEGLVRFDGARFVVFVKQNTKEIKNNYIFTLYEDAAGTLWIGTHGGGLSCLKDGTFTSHTTEEGLSSNFVRCIRMDREGYLWIGTDNGLNRYKDGKFIHFTTGDGLASNIVSSLYEDPEGILWIGTSRGLNRLNEGRFTTYTVENGLSNNTILSLLGDPEGGLWIGTRGGLDRFKDGEFTSYTTEDGLSNNGVLSLCRDEEGNLWIGTYGGGLNRLKNTEITALTSSEGLSGDIIWSIYEDNEKNLWVGTHNGGLNCLGDGKFLIYTTREGLSNDVVFSVFEDKDSNIWMGTNVGLNRLKHGKLSAYTIDNGLSNNFAFSACGDRRGNIWIGTYGGGLNRLKNEKIFTYSDKDGLSSDYIRFIFEDIEDTLWIGTNSGLNRLKDGKFTSYSMKDGFPHDVLLSICQRLKGGLWIGTYGGLALFENGKVTSYTTEDGLSENVIYAVYEDMEGILWLGTRSGLNRFKDGRFMTYTTKDGLYDDLGYQILEDGKRNLWISCNKGIFRVSKKELNDFASGKIHSVHSIAYEIADGLKSCECNGGFQPAGWKSRDGKLWFPTIKGVAMIDPEKIKINEKPPPVIIEKIIIDNESIDFREKMQLPPGKKTFEFHYTGLSYICPRKVKFKFILIGFNKGWLDVGNRRTAYYTNIPPGTYTFRVIACNNDGVWNKEGASLELVLDPYFYQTSWFYVLCTLGVGLLGIGIHRLRVRQLKKHKKELESLVLERTHNLMEEKKNVEKAQAELKDKNRDLRSANVKLREMNEFKSLVLSIVAHDLRTPLNAIIGFSEMLRDEAEGSPQFRETSQIIYQSSCNLLKMLNDLLDLATIERGKLKCNKESFDLGELAAFVIENNLFPAKQKGQTILLSIEEEWCTILADKGKTAEIMNNLLSNAIKYSPLNASIWVSVFRNEESVHFEVRDEGPGLTEEDQKKLFSKFQRLSARPTAGESSLGLGLFIVKELVELHGGCIRVESEVGKGSRFIVEFPSVD